MSKGRTRTSMRSGLRWRSNGWRCSQRLALYACLVLDLQYGGSPDQDPATRAIPNGQPLQSRPAMPAACCERGVSSTFASCPLDIGASLLHGRVQSRRHHLLDMTDLPQCHRTRNTSVQKLTTIRLLIRYARTQPTKLARRGPYLTVGTPGGNIPQVVRPQRTQHKRCNCTPSPGAQAGHLNHLVAVGLGIRAGQRGPTAAAVVGLQAMTSCTSSTGTSTR